MRPRLSRERAEPAQAEPVPTFDALYRQHAAFVFRLLRGMGVSDSRADDAMQDVFVVVLRRLPEFDGKARVTTWLFAIVYRVACRYRRTGRAAGQHGPLTDELADRASSPQQRAESSQALRQLSRALDTLDDEKRMTVLLADLEGLSVPEIATLVDAPLNTVYTRLRRARAALAAQLEQLREEAP